MFPSTVSREDVCNIRTLVWGRVPAPRNAFIVYLIDESRASAFAWQTRIQICTTQTFLPDERTAGLEKSTDTTLGKGSGRTGKKLSLLGRGDYVLAPQCLAIASWWAGNPFAPRSDCLARGQSVSQAIE